ncbi:IgGFc-binding protein-like isoform X1 [Branchiostoma floridae x Branchiostoma japonicum]
MTMTNFRIKIPSLIISLRTVWMVLLVSSSLGTKAQERLQSKYHSKRHLLQLGNMMMCATGRVPSDYLDYGCFCGPGGDMKYAAMDDTDQCCRDHDKCYDDLTRRCPGYLFGLIPFPYLAIYSYQYYSCLSVLSTSWTKVSPDVSRAPQGAANVIIQCNDSFRDNKGSEFVLSFVENFQRAGHRPQLLISGTSPEPTSVVVDVPLVGFTSIVNVRFGEVATVNLPRDGVEMRGSRKGRHAVSIRAEDDIIVYGVFTERDSTDGYLGLPIDVLGTEYLVPCSTVTSNRPEEGFVHIPSEFGLVGAYDNTTVVIVPSQPVVFEDQSYDAKARITTTLSKFETLQIQSSDDLTGSLIISSKPVAVLSGNVFASVGTRAEVRGSGAHIVEMIPPVSTWGKQFALVPLKERDKGDVFRVLASKDNTQVNLTGNVPRVIQAGEFWEFNLPSYRYKYLTASDPILLVQYSKSKTVDQARADPFMMLIPAVSQYATNYSFTTVDFAVLRLVGTYHLNIVVSTAEKNGLRLNDNPLDSQVQWTVIPGTKMSAARLDVMCGSHTLVHVSPGVTFGVSLYGFTDWDGYGYPGGLRLTARAWWAGTSQGVDAGPHINDKEFLIDPQYNREDIKNMAPTDIPPEAVQWKDYTESKVLIIGFCAMLLVLVIVALIQIQNRCKDDISSTSMEVLELEDPSSDH